jgi:hypothetical protein
LQLLKDSGQLNTLLKNIWIATFAGRTEKAALSHTVVPAKTGIQKRLPGAIEMIRKRASAPRVRSVSDIFGKLTHP